MHAESVPCHSLGWSEAKPQELAEPRELKMLASKPHSGAAIAPKGAIRLRKAAMPKAYAAFLWDDNGVGAWHDMALQTTGRLRTGKKKAGDVLLSHAAAHAVPSTQKSLTAEFGMGSGVASLLLSPARL